MTNQKITVTYSSVDGYREHRSFKTLDDARKYAHRWLGETPEMGQFYAVSHDGIGKIEVSSGAKVADLFPKLALVLSHPRHEFLSYEQMQSDPGYDYDDEPAQPQFAPPKKMTDAEWEALAAVYGNPFEGSGS